MFSSAERDATRTRLIERAEADERIVGVAITGSHAVGASDAWSDIDLAFAVAPGADREELMRDFSAWMERELGVLHFWDLPHESSIYRVYLLRDLLEVDVAFTPAGDFAARGPGFRCVFGQPQQPIPVRAPNVDALVGHAWHHALHARAAIERSRPWQAEYMISGLRDQLLALLSVRHGKPSAYARGADQLEPALTAGLEATLVASLEPAELRRALRAALEAMQRVLLECEPALAENLSAPLRELRREATE